MVQRGYRAFRAGRVLQYARQKKKDDEEKVRRILLRIKMGREVATFNAWHDLAATNVKARRLLARHMMGFEKSIFTRWQHFTTYTKRRKRTLVKMAQKWVRGHQARARLRRWNEAACAVQRVGRSYIARNIAKTFKRKVREDAEKIAKSLRRIRHGTLCAAFLPWRDNVVRGKRARRLASRCLGNVKTDRFWQWREGTAMLIRNREYDSQTKIAAAFRGYVVRARKRVMEFGSARRRRRPAIHQQTMSTNKRRLTFDDPALVQLHPEYTSTRLTALREELAEVQACTYRFYDSTCFLQRVRMDGTGAGAFLNALREEIGKEVQWGVQRECEEMARATGKANVGLDATWQKQLRTYKGFHGMMIHVKDANGANMDMNGAFVPDFTAFVKDSVQEWLAMHKFGWLSQNLLVQWIARGLLCEVDTASKRMMAFDVVKEIVPNSILRGVNTAYGQIQMKKQALAQKEVFGSSEEYQEKADKPREVIDTDGMSVKEVVEMYIRDAELKDEENRLAGIEEESDDDGVGGGDADGVVDDILEGMDSSVLVKHLHNAHQMMGRHRSGRQQREEARSFLGAKGTNAENLRRGNEGSAESAAAELNTLAATLTKLPQRRRKTYFKRRASKSSEALSRNNGASRSKSLPTFGLTPFTEEAEEVGEEGGGGEGVAGGGPQLPDVFLPDCFKVDVDESPTGGDGGDGGDSSKKGGIEAGGEAGSEADDGAGDEVGDRAGGGAELKERAGAATATTTTKSNAPSKVLTQQEQQQRREAATAATAAAISKLNAISEEERGKETQQGRNLLFQREQRREQQRVQNGGKVVRKAAGRAMGKVNVKGKGKGKGKGSVAGETSEPNSDSDDDDDVVMDAAMTAYFDKKKKDAEYAKRRERIEHKKTLDIAQARQERGGKGAGRDARKDDGRQMRREALAAKKQKAERKGRSG